MKTAKFTLCILLMAATIAPSCVAFSETVKGNKNIVSKTFDISDYTEICFTLPGEMVYRKTADKAPSLQITTDENILPLLEVEVEKGYLKIKRKEHTANIKPSQLIVYSTSS
jgi:hypothetical protein